MASKGLSSEDLKKAGNELFARSKFNEAIQKYSQAIALDFKNHVLFTNRALCYFQLGRYEESLVDAMHSVDIEPKWVKGHFVRANSLFHLNRLSDAMLACTNGIAACGGADACPQLTELTQQITKKLPKKSAGTNQIAITTKSDTLLSVPPATLGIVLSFLPILEVAKLRRVCKTFNESATKLTCIPTINFEGQSVHPNFFTRGLGPFQTLSSVKTLSLGFSSLPCLAALKRFSGLEGIQFQNCRVRAGPGLPPGPDPITSTLIPFLQHRPQLKDIGVVEFPMTPQLEKALFSMTALRKLVLGGEIVKMTEDFVVKALSSLPHLENFASYVDKCTTKTLETFLRVGSKMTVFEIHPGVSEIPKTSVCAKEVAKWKAPTRLTQFICLPTGHMQHLRVGCGPDLCNILQISPNLTHLIISLTNEEGLKILGQPMPNLNYAIFQLVGTWPQFSKFFRLIAKNCPSLQDLSFRNGVGAYITTSDLLSLVPTLGKKLQSLEMFDLNTHTDEWDISQLAQFVTKMEKLKSFQFECPEFEYDEEWDERLLDMTTSATWLRDQVSITRKLELEIGANRFGANILPFLTLFSNSPIHFMVSCPKFTLGQDIVEMLQRVEYVPGFKLWIPLNDRESWEECQETTRNRPNHALTVMTSLRFSTAILLSLRIKNWNFAEFPLPDDVPPERLAYSQSMIHMGDRNEIMTELANVCSQGNSTTFPIWKFVIAQVVAEQPEILDWIREDTAGSLITKKWVSERHKAKFAALTADWQTKIATRAPAARKMISLYEKVSKDMEDRANKEKEKKEKEQKEMEMRRIIAAKVAAARKEMEEQEAKKT